MSEAFEQNEKYVYDHIPSLKELIPSTGGLPGVEYAQVTTDRLWLAQKNGWSKLSGRQKIYTIRGPAGEVHCELYGKGKPIKGQSMLSGRRICWLDKTIREKTGLSEIPTGGEDKAPTQEKSSPEVGTPKSVEVKGKE